METQRPSQTRLSSQLLWCFRQFQFNCALPTTVDYSSDVAFQVNLGGALGDLNWLDEGDPAMISFQSPHDVLLRTPRMFCCADHQRTSGFCKRAFDIPMQKSMRRRHRTTTLHSRILVWPMPSRHKLWPMETWAWDGLYPVKNDYVNNAPTPAHRWSSLAVVGCGNNLSGRRGQWNHNC